ncbi:MAG: 50S ribosomal protein L20 [Proteocatella sp.]
MARVKRAMNARKKHKKILKLAKGFRGARSKLYRPANEFVMKALAHAYKGRKLKKRDFRKMWIARINAATRINGLSYSKFMNGLKKADITINRKMLSEMAINDPAGFAQLVETAKKAI